MREWLEAIRSRLSVLGADANNPTPSAPPRASKNNSDTPLAKQSLLPKCTPRSDDARASQVRWLFAQEAPLLSEDDVEQGASPVNARKPTDTEDDQVASGAEYVICLGGYQMRASHIVLLVWLLATAALAEGLYICTLRNC